ncbi:MAG TPA: efflux RND transporter periplasmic adaptor subunit [Steroidobacteraceae bacterium]|nr:efflux RND transporter periplasmic adaptor subunit [Steroidobacteraceae bacterium]
MDRPAPRNRWSPAQWPKAAQLGAAALAALLVVLGAIRLFAGSGERTVRVPATQLVLSSVERGTFHDLIPLRAQVEPLETLYIDAIDGGRIDRVLVEAGDHVQQGQPLIELSNTNLALSVIQQESQLNQAMSQLQQNEIALEQNNLANDRALAEIDYNLVRLTRSDARREGLAASGAASKEQRDEVADELAYYRHLQPIQMASTKRQSDLRERLLPDIQRQLQNLRANLDIVQAKLAALIIRAPAAGVVTAINLKVGELRNPGERLAEVTPESGMKLAADVDEYYLARVRSGQSATVDINGTQLHATVHRVSPQVKNGQFTIDLEFAGKSPANLVAGETADGRLQLGGDSQAVILPVGPFLDRTGGDWVFVLARDGKSAQRRRIKVGRRTSEQLEILSGLASGDRVVTSDYTGLDRADRIVLTQ